MALAGGVVAVLLIGAFTLLLTTIFGLRDAGVTERRSEAVLISSDRLEKSVTDLDEEARGLVLTGDSRFLRDYTLEKAAMPAEEADLVRLVAHGDGAQAVRARRIVQAGEAYVRGYVAPLVDAERTDPAAARSMLQGGEGPQRLSALRAECAAFASAQRTIAARSEQHSIDAARDAAITAGMSGGGALLLVCCFVVYLTRVIVHPVRRAALAAGALAEGDFAVRMPETSPGELGTIGTRFNSMVGSLKMSRDRLRQFAGEQGALRRVATLVACGVSPTQVFDAVAAEVGHLLGVDHTEIIRFESDDTARVVGYWSDPRVPEVMPPLNGHWPVESGTVTSAVLTTERPARMKNYERATSAIGIWAHTAGIRCVVGCPIKVEGRVWGAMLIHSLDAEPLPGVTEDRMQEFMDLVGAAIANAQSRSDLLASRARVVAAADESRRRIERDLHDGAQQQLVTLTLKLRTLETTAVAPGQDRLRGELSDVVHDLSNVLDDLQEVSRGIVPPILTRSGLRPALRSLARHSPVPVTLQADVAGRLPESVEVAVYYTVSETLTNVVKHASASEVRVDLVLEHRTVCLSVHDDGRGGADFAGGSGLVGLKDRVEALGGSIEVLSPAGGGTSVLVHIPLPDR
ncbi:HAMP domain-containing protein [Actinomadura sp. DC4]|uniref:sensor histidine kinase n=1 Tax=Actinomadura sp. DC4 TaxID=3055069 RepID=UPI0025B00BB5|nr:HAMP domain-containing protein [Actinomadura sp. DC4]MDN3358832.1 CHASE3 domain-containing protein [Actinomadura sp. DC4]